MISARLPLLLLLLAAGLVSACASPASAPADVRRSVELRVATYNLEDVRGDDLARHDHPRLRALAAQIQRVRPDVLLLSEIAFDQEGSPGYRAEEGPGANARRFAERYLAVSQGPGLEPLRYDAFSAPTNTGIASGFDLNNDGEVVDRYPDPDPADASGAPGAQTAAGRRYGEDAWGFGTFPGQYGMALLVRDDLEILEDSVRTFRLLPWSAMPDHAMPVDSATGAPWYDAAEASAFRLSSKSHWDVPVRLPNGAVLHVLASHPTPPAFDGPEGRNRRRNHDEIRLWAEYLDGAAWIVDDSSRAGGFEQGAPFVIVGDLNADPDEGSSLDDPIGRLLLSHPLVDGTFVPVADTSGASAREEFDTDDTSGFRLRVDYVLPSRQLRVLDGAVERPRLAEGERAPTDHFLVWLDVAVPGP